MEDSLVNLQLNGFLKIRPHLAHVATLHSETLMSAKPAIDDKLQGSVATYLRCGGVVNNQIDRYIGESRSTGQNFRLHLGLNIGLENLVSVLVSTVRSRVA